MEKSILLKTWEVQAILNNRKTQKRIVAKNIPSIVTKIEKIASDRFAWYYGLQDKSMIPTYQVDGILWVKETWNGDWCDHYIYKADGGSAKAAGYAKELRWKPSIHMPKEAARIWLKVTDVRVEKESDKWYWIIDLERIENK